MDTVRRWEESVAKQDLGGGAQVEDGLVEKQAYVSMVFDAPSALLR
jgi:hypothetical protein